MPANQLDMVLFLEADRMKALAITKETLDNQREAVKEERRLRVDNQPYGRTSETIDELAFENFVNKHSVIGSMTDLDAASVEDVTAFFKTYYVPNNAAIAIAGDVDPAVALDKVRKYFESIPAGPPPPAVVTTEPGQKSERRTASEDPLARLPLIAAAYHIPGGLSPDMDALTALASILGSGRTARLYDSLVRQQQLPRSTRARLPPGSGLTIEVVMAPGGAAEGGSRYTPKSRRSRTVRFRMGLEAEWRAVLSSTASETLCNARFFCHYAVFYNDPRHQQPIRAHRGEDGTCSASRDSFVPENRTVAVTNSPAGPAAPAGR